MQPERLRILRRADLGVRADALAAGQHLPIDRAVRAECQIPAAGRELAHADVVVTDIAEAVAVRVYLGWVGVVWAVVGGIGHPVTVAIGIAGIADPVAVDVALSGVGDGGAVVGSGAEAA